MLSKTENSRQQPSQTLASEQAISALPKYSIEQAEMQSAAARLLSLDDAYTVRANHRGAGPFFVCADGTCFQIADELGQPIIANAEDLETICDALDASDFILRTLEAKLSLQLEPADIAAEIDNSRFVFLTLSGAEMGVTIAIPNGHANARRWMEQAAQIAPNAADTPCVLKLQCVAAHLDIAEARDLANGDMLLLTRRMAMQIGAGPISLDGIFDSGDGLFTAATGTETLERSSQMNDHEQPGDAEQFLVPVSIRLPDKMVSMETLAALKAGANLPIGPLLQGLPVDIVIAGQRLASGEIVQIGGDFAVLVGERAPPVKDHVATLDDVVTPAEGEE
jgi:flagellar motor switch/type III secretory pathway protein FliN